MGSLAGIMSDQAVTEVNNRAVRRIPPRSEIPVARPMWFLRWLMLLALIVGLVSLWSYALTTSELRSSSPGLAAWWQAHRFYFMEGGATAFGLLLGIRIGDSLMVDRGRCSHRGFAALVLAIIAFTPLIHACARAARLGWNGRGASIASWIISRNGYDAGRWMDKVVIVGAYFLKTVGFALLAGLVLIAIAFVIVDVLAPPKAEAKAGAVN